MASLYLRNKGTAIKPKWQVVESRRIHGKKTPRQKIICTFGDIKNSAEIIKRWELILDDARIAERAHWDIKYRNRKFPLVKRYARKISFDEIKSRYDKIVSTAERLDWHQKGSIFKKQLKIKINRGIVDDSNRTQEFSQKLSDLLTTIADIIADDNLATWSNAHKQRMRARLDFAIQFYHRL